MKRTPLQRKTPLRTKTALKPKSQLKRLTPLRNSGGVDAKKVQQSKSRGLSGHGRTATDKAWHSRVAALGCFVCNHLGAVTTECLRIHHPIGRNKGRDGDCCERFVICLCDLHHDPSIMCKGVLDGPSAHGNKRLFRELVGSEAWCVYETYRALHVRPVWLEEGLWGDYLSLAEQSEQEVWITERERYAPRLREIA